VTARTLAIASVIALVGTALAQPSKPNDPKAPAPAAKGGDGPDLMKLLATRVTLEKQFDGKFKDAVKMLSDKYDLPIVVDPHVGEGEAGAAALAAATVVAIVAELDAGNAPADDKPVTLPKFVNVRLDTLLNILVAQVNAKFLVYPDYVKIVPEFFAAYESGVLKANSDPNEESSPLSATDLLRNKPLIKRALVNVSFKNKPLGDAIDEIVESTGANVAVSPLLPANVRQSPITVRFANTPVDVAVRTLCEMTECGVIEDANVLLVTTPERAAARAKDEAQKARERRPVQQAIIGLGQQGVFASQPDLVGEVAKLKEQNEQLKKQLEQLEKLLKKMSEK
jgi:hypothetical protein